MAVSIPTVTKIRPFWLPKKHFCFSLRTKKIRFGVFSAVFIGRFSDPLKLFISHISSEIHRRAQKEHHHIHNRLEPGGAQIPAIARDTPQPGALLRVLTELPHHPAVHSPETHDQRDSQESIFYRDLS